MPDLKTELPSDSTQEILSHIPHWIVRWGITTMFFAILILFIISWMIYYPDIVVSRITITSDKPPIHLIARSRGKLTLFVHEGDTVTTNMSLGIIENPASTEDVLRLQNILVQIDKYLKTPKESMIDSIPINMRLGELQDEYSQLLESCHNLSIFLKTDLIILNVQSLKKEIELSENIHQRLVAQKEIHERELELSKKKFENQTTLYEKHFISEAELANFEHEYLGKKNTVELTQSEILNNSIQRTKYQKEILDLTQQSELKKQNLLVTLWESMKKMESELASWEQRYLLKSPIDGIVSFFKYWSSNQFVNDGDEIMTITSQSHAMIGKMVVQQSGAGKIMTGQVVKIKFDTNPSNEFGVVEGTIQSISLAPQNNCYSVTVILPRVLYTTYHKVLDFKEGMQGTAEIITKELSLLERIFYRLRYFFTPLTS